MSEANRQADLPGKLVADSGDTSLQRYLPWLSGGLAVILGIGALNPVAGSAQAGFPALTWVYAICGILLLALAVLATRPLRDKHGDAIAGAILMIWAASAIAALHVNGTAVHSGEIAVIMFMAALLLKSSAWFSGLSVGMLGAWVASLMISGNVHDGSWSGFGILLAAVALVASIVFRQQNSLRELARNCLSTDQKRRETLTRNLDKLDHEMIRSANIEKRLQRANQKLRVLARVDTLTGIANKRQLKDYLDREWRRHGRDQAPLSLILCDIDHFKAYNDHFGAQHGDDTLQRVAKIIEDSLHRPADLAARHAGSVFAALLPNTEIGQARHVAATMQEKIAARAIPHPRSPLGKILTLSLGVTSVIPTERMQESILMETAERALADAKEQGQNRSIVEPVADGGI